MSVTARPRRSVLYMPGSRPRALEKARSLPADALILDLEDAVGPTEKVVARDLAAVPGAQELEDAHNDYLIAVTRALLDLAVQEGEIEPVDTPAVARTMAGLGRDLTRPEVMATLESSPKDAADA